MTTILVTGGAGYIGSHCCKAFAAAGWDVVVYDNLKHGWRDMVKWGPLIEGDILDADALTAAIAKVKPNAVAHFAALISVAESVADPALHYRNNAIGSFNILEAMRANGVGKIIFSSTAATYGAPKTNPIPEDHPQQPINPYGWSKLMVERMLADYDAAYGLRYAALRYFNAAGADPDGQIGERHEPETHVIPLAARGALRDDYRFTIFGEDYDTRDGTCVRDYLHVTDLAAAHRLALDYLMKGGESAAFNLGSGEGRDGEGDRRGGGARLEPSLAPRDRPPPRRRSALPHRLQRQGAAGAGVGTRALLHRGDRADRVCVAQEG